MQVLVDIPALFELAQTALYLKKKVSFLFVFV